MNNKDAAKDGFVMYEGSKAADSKNLLEAIEPPARSKEDPSTAIGGC